MANPKLEFFRFKLNHKSGNSKTFRQFMVENGKVTNRQKDNAIFTLLYKYVMEKPKKDYKKDDGLKKVVTLIANKKINKHYDERPQPKHSQYIISGVINGGPFGKNRMLGNLNNKDNVTNIFPNQPVLQYYYVFLYLPLDHSEGFIMVHSDSAEETITQAFRKYIAELFQLGDYKKPVMQVYVPKFFRDEYKNGAVLQSMTFMSTELSADLDDDDPIKNYVDEYEVKITLTPLGNQKADMSKLDIIRNLFIQKRFGTQQINRGLGEFGKCMVKTMNKGTKTSKEFDWNNRDMEILPSVYLKGRVPMGTDGTPVFTELETFCHNLFEDQILPEIRPDKYVQRVDSNT